ncbi:hypothetical protein BJQ94_14255 [Cryobacterium sp. SO2]|uniref:hypothetical protein n=1 Tax=Cryobacterium sp. SO2 TaxID=1897060 RepID=UPI00223C9744|nr:hypothetical protein [Cryobacterium sp. SO2]WEO76520.1 hypothetical protein BJQ94_14255 [Cryobacterium sp. SO2]
MTERTMTPAEAAALLEVAIDAEPEQVERAYRYQAQRSHPDRLAAATPAEQAAAAARFDRYTLARSVLRDADAERMRASPAAGPAGPGAAERGSGGGGSAGSSAFGVARGANWGANWAADEPYEPVVPAGPWLFWVWVGLYAVAAVIAFIGGPLPYSAADLWLRLLPLGLAAVAFARTGRRGFLAVVVALGAATAVLTILFASFGPLVSMILLGAPVLGLVALGRQRGPQRPDAAGAPRPAA